jgi:hypothetical protein
MGNHRHGRHHGSRHLSAVPTNTSGSLHADAPQLGKFDTSFAPPLEPGADEMKSLQAFVGGFDELMHLDAEPLPNEEFDWSTVEPQDETFVALVLMLVDECCDQMLDNEYRTIARRMLARIAARDPRVLRRSENTDRFAAGLVWLAGRGSGGFARRGSRPKSGQLWRWFGVTDCSDRGRSLRAAADLFPDADLADYTFSDELALGDAGLLHSRFRKSLVIQRDTRLDITAEREQRSPVVAFDGNRLVVAVEQIAVLGAAKSLPVDGERLGICILLGTELDKAKCYDLSIPDAHKLIYCLQAALDDPPPRREP